MGMKTRCWFHHGRTNNILPWTPPSHSHAVHTSTTTRNCLATSAVRYTAPNHPPNPLALHQTTSLLAPAYRSWSPSLGAALSCSPFIGNLLRVPTSSEGTPASSHSSSTTASSSKDFQHASQLASLIYFQLIRESPLHVTRTQSLPAAYLNPSLIGSLLGLSFPTNQTSSSKSLINYFKQTHGIKSNYIDKTYWTGISMQRWKDLMLLPSDAKRQPLTIASDYPLVSAVWLVALWNTLGASSSLTQSATSVPISSSTKQHLWEFLTSADQAVRQGSPSHPGILDPNNPLAQAILHDAGAREEWLAQEFTLDDLSDDALEEAWDILLYHQPSEKEGAQQQQDWADALDRVCAALVLEQYPTHAKPTCPNGYYAPEPAKDNDPDIPIMLTADCAEVMAREIMDVLVWDEERGCRDVTRLPSTASPVLRQLVQPTATGNDWFQALYDLPDCQYLAETPKGQPYELAPILSNILRALQHHWEGPPSTRTTAPWDTLEDFAAGVSSTTSLLVQQQTLTHRSASTGNLIRHEVGVLRRADASWGIEVRLRCDWDNLSGMAAVTHMQEPKRAILPGGSTTSRLSPPWDRFKESHPAALLLGLATTTELPNKVPRVTGEPTASTLIRLLTTPYGVDRRPLAVSPNHDDVSWLQDYQEASDIVLVTAIEQACQWACEQEADESNNNNAAAALMAWILDEVPTVVEGMTHSQATAESILFQQRVETAIQSLPKSTLADPGVQQAIHWNWACRGKPLAAWAQWHCGQVNSLQVLGRLSLADMTVFGAFCQTSK